VTLSWRGQVTALPLARSTVFIFKYSNYGNSFQQICAVGGLIKTGGQIYTSSVQYLMLAILPQETAGYVIYFTLVGYEGRCPIFTIVLSKFLFRKSSHIQDTFGSYFESWTKGRPCTNRGLPFAESDPIA
jgi:hypothetical protein